TAGRPRRGRERTGPARGWCAWAGGCPARSTGKLAANGGPAFRSRGASGWPQSVSLDQGLTATTSTNDTEVETEQRCPADKIMTQRRGKSSKFFLTGTSITSGSHRAHGPLRESCRRERGRQGPSGMVRLSVHQRDGKQGDWEYEDETALAGP